MGKKHDKEIIDAMTFIKEQHNGELPYQFGTFECAKMMAKYLKQHINNLWGCNTLQQLIRQF